MSEAVVGRALLRVGQHAVGFRNLFELLFRFLFAVGIAVGVVLHGEAAIGALDLLVGGFPRYAQDFVIVTLLLQSSTSVVWRFYAKAVPGRAPSAHRYRSALSCSLIHWKRRPALGKRLDDFILRSILALRFIRGSLARACLPPPP